MLSPRAMPEFLLKRSRSIRLYVPVFSLPAHARKALLASAQLIGRSFFGVTMFASSRFFSARDNHDLELSQRLLRLDYAGFKP